jgi:hypothetical protein
MTRELRLAACAIMASMIVAAQTAGASDEGGFISSANPGEWRASKLVGVSIYGPDDKSIGKVDDVIVDASGATKVVVVGVGGFLGMGRKEVGLPFSQIKWSDTPPPVKVSATTAPGAMPPLATAPPPMPAGSAEAKKLINDYPDHGSVAATKDQLKAAPDFHYASEQP